mmetsp:Transcript_4692/g.5408  ORF Transcript_4692/g.5408 Transcript_4692/m.5408 type:complete len:476 (+) Transcript_4692:38-1465(+)|eukprot:CAMPEP_0184042292 /NCGR_PEP_ID=MMETSP0955-20130417/66269_1 /TAXON_ID=627963 /ORGANISM="Aplanochytrium sp, Strain PBS07" /LENGTH=475 /DNA_ID=CAMNT_0026333043 /DNA_START=42 /DNA_END=1469 /DNA_ORIENTATION=-
MANQLYSDSTRVILERLIEKEKYPMKVVPFSAFEKHGKLPRSDDGLAVSYREGMNVIFVSHRWWNTLSEIPNPDVPPTKKSANLKHYIICKTVNRGRKTGLFDSFDTKEEIYLWMDFACIDQDNPENKLKGVQSLTSYIARSDVMLIPMRGTFSKEVHLTKNYGERAWCRLECFIFTVIERAKSPMVPPRLFFVGTKKGHRVGNYRFLDKYRPSKGQVTLESDIPAIKEIESEAIELMGFSLIEFGLADWLENDNAKLKIKKQLLGDVHMEMLADKISNVVDSNLELSGKLSLHLCSNLISSVGVQSLLELGIKDRIVGIDLYENNIGENGLLAIANFLKQSECTLSKLRLELIPGGCSKAVSVAFAESLKVNQSLCELSLGDNNIGGLEGVSICTSLASNSTLKKLDLSKNRIGVKGAKGIATFLESNTGHLSFTHLFLGYNNLGSTFKERMNAWKKLNPESNVVVEPSPPLDV